MISRAGLRVWILVLAASIARPAAGQTKTIRISSKLLGEERVLHVNLPPNYSVARRRYDVIYLLDGHVREFFDVTVAAAAYDLVGDTHDYAQPPQIVVGIDQRDRGTDLGRNQELFTRFLTDEVVPYVDRNYRTTGYRTLIGHSLGGRFALMTLCRTPGVFPSVIAISAAGGDSTSGDAVTSCLRSALTSEGTTIRKVFISAGDREERIKGGLERLNELLRTSAPANWRWTTLVLPGLGHTDTPLATIPPALRFVHDRAVWEMSASLADSVTEGRLDPGRAIDAFYATLSRRIGSPVAPSLKWMLAEARVRIRQSDRTAAESAVRRLIAAYPEDLEGYGMQSDIALRMGDTTAARRSLEDALRMLGRLEMHDVYEAERKRRLLENALSSLRR